MSETSLCKEELIVIKERFLKNHRLISRQLGICKESQMRNLKRKLKKGKIPWKIKSNQTAWMELEKCAEQICRINKELSNLNKERHYLEEIALTVNIDKSRRIKSTLPCYLSLRQTA